MTPAMHAGNTRNLNYTVKDRTGAAVNLTGASITWRMAAARDGAALVSKSTSSGITVTSAANGLFTVALAAADTATLEPGTYWHQATVTDGSGNVVTILTDTMQILPLITAS